MAEIEGKPDDFWLRDGNQYYLFCYDLPMVADANVAMYVTQEYDSKFPFTQKIRSVTWMDNGESVEFRQEQGSAIIQTVPFIYGRSLVVRVAKITVEA